MIKKTYVFEVELDTEEDFQLGNRIHEAIEEMLDDEEGIKKYEFDIKDIEARKELKRKSYLGTRN